MAKAVRIKGKDMRYAYVPEYGLKFTEEDKFGAKTKDLIEKERETKDQSFLVIKSIYII